MTNLLALSLIATSSTIQVHYQAAELMQQQRYSETVSLCRATFQKLDPHSLSAALMLRDMARAYRLDGSFNRAEAAQRAELQIVKTRLGEDDPNVAISLDRLGEIYFNEGRFNEARKLFVKSLAIAEKSLGGAQLAIVLNDLGAALIRDGHPEQAEPLLRRALAIREVADPEHAEVTRANLKCAKIQK